MTAESMKEIVGNFQSVYTIVLALAIAEGFNQSVKESHPQHEAHASTFRSWIECLHPSRLPSLLVFLLLAAPFLQGNEKYLYAQYVEPLRGPHPPKTISAFALNIDCLTFTLQAGLFFVMSRSLSARRWQQFYATVVLLLLIDLVWFLFEKGRGAVMPVEWAWFDLIVMGVFSLIIALDWFLVPPAKKDGLNVYAYGAISLLAILGLSYGYLYQVDFLIES